MFRKILIPTDGSDTSRKAVEQGIAFAKEIGAQVVGFHAPADYRAVMLTELAAPPIAADDFDEQVENAARTVLASAERTAVAAGVPYESAFAVTTAPWRAIIDAAEQNRCDLIFMGSHGHSGLLAVVLGSQTQKVLTHSKIPVLVTR